MRHVKRCCAPICPKEKTITTVEIERKRGREVREREREVEGKRKGIETIIREEKTGRGAMLQYSRFYSSLFNKVN